MSKTRSFLRRKAVERIPAPMLDLAGKAVLKGVDEAVERRWDRARERAADAAGNSVDGRVKSVARAFSREMVSLGVATGASAAAPGVGTAGALSLLGAEMTWFAFRATDLIMTIGALHGHDDATPEERRAWVLAILAHGERAADEFAQLVGDLDRSAVVGGEKVGALMAGVVSGDVAAIDTLRRVNAGLGARVAARFGTTRGVLTVGKLLPFGVGAVVGGSANWALTRAVTVQSTTFFRRYHEVVVPPPPSLPPPPAADAPALPAPSPVDGGAPPPPSDD